MIASALKIGSVHHEHLEQTDATGRYTDGGEQTATDCILCSLDLSISCSRSMIKIVVYHHFAISNMSSSISDSMRG